MYGDWTSEYNIYLHLSFSRFIVSVIKSMVPLYLYYYHAVHFSSLWLHPPHYRQVIVIDQGNNTVLAEFSGGSNIEIRVKNRIVSVMLVSLPDMYQSLTRGLMGNYNGDTSDDLAPRGSTISIPIDSTMEDIFTLGNTCMFIQLSYTVVVWMSHNKMCRLLITT